MTIREQVGHLYRRFGFGATQEELDKGEAMGLDNAMHHLLDYRAVDEEFPVHPYEFSWRDKDDSDPSAGNFRLWWTMRMVCGKRPAQEQLTLFWHGHFAVSDGKVEDGPMMLQYLGALREHANGQFVNLLKAVSKDPAMLRYLDLQRSFIGSPNENFAREVMELFTLGIGNYSEKDVKEAARAFTGWSYQNLYYEFPGNNTRKLKDSMKYNRPFSSFSLMTAMHDRNPKTILGKTDFFDGDKFLELLADHPQTVRHICTKLWTYYAYPDPEPTVIDRLAVVWEKTGGEIRHLMFAIARSPEFWSDKCVRNKIKSPADLFVGVARQMGADKGLMTLRGPANSETPIVRSVPNNLYGLIDRMDKTGLSLFYPKDVSGWKGGEAWISPAAMVERYRFRGMMLYGNRGPGEGAKFTYEWIKAQKPADSKSIATGICTLFDVPMTPEGIDLLTKVVDKNGGIKVLDKVNSWTSVLDRSLLVLMAAPEMQMC